MFAFLDNKKTQSNKKIKGTGWCKFISTGLVIMVLFYVALGTMIGQANDDEMTGKQMQIKNRKGKIFNQYLFHRISLNNKDHKP